jgi:hypothetical protein
MFSLLYIGTRLEYEKGPGFVVLSTFTAILLKTMLKAAHVQLGRDGVWPLYSYSFLKSLTEKALAADYFARLGVGFSGVLLDLQILFAMDSSFGPLLRIVAAVGLGFDAFHRKGAIKSRIHWGHMYGIMTGLCQVAFTKVWSFFVMRKRRENSSLSAEPDDPPLKSAELSQRDEGIDNKPMNLKTLFYIIEERQLAII